jgi:hypothetical protein
MVYGTLLYISDCAVDWFEEDQNSLLEEDRAETAVERANALILQDLAKATNETIGETRLGHKTDTGGLKRAQSDISDELGGGGGGEIDGGAVVGGGLVAELVDPHLLEELVTSELQGALEEVAGGGGTEASPDGASTLVGNDFAETADQAIVVGDGVELYPRLDAVGGDGLLVMLLMLVDAIQRQHFALVG